MRQVGMRYGLILGLISIVFSMLSHLLGWSDPASGQTGMGFILILISLAVMFIIIFMALKHYRDEVNQGALSLGQGIQLGIIVAIVGGLISGLFSVIYFTLIEPAYYDSILAFYEENLEDRGMSGAQLEQALKWTRMFSNPVMTFVLTIISSAFFGLIVSLIAGLILKKEPAPPTVDREDI